MNNAHADWRKSSYSGGGMDCVELDFGSDAGIRDSKDPGGPVLRVSRKALADFLHGVKAGEFDDLI
jgi:hypothetical protein